MLKVKLQDTLTQAQVDALLGLPQRLYEAKAGHCASGAVIRPISRKMERATLQKKVA